MTTTHKQNTTTTERELPYQKKLFTSFLPFFLQFFYDKQKKLYTLEIVSIYVDLYETTSRKIFKSAAIMNLAGCKGNDTKKNTFWAKSQVAEMYQAQVMDAFKKSSIDGKLFTTSVFCVNDVHELGIPNIPAGQIFNAYHRTHSAEIKKKLEKNNKNWNPGATNHAFECNVTNGKNTKRIMMKKTITIRQIRNMINDIWSLNDNEYELIGSGHPLTEPDKTLEQYGIIESTVFACITNTHGGGSIISRKEDTGKEYVKIQNVRREYVSKKAIAKKEIPKEDIGKGDEQRVRHFNPKKNPEIKLATKRDIITLDDNELILRAQMPCGHAIGAQTMYEYIKWRLSKDLATTDICCPDPKCARKWDWSL
ncbi:hypothetical protein RFI_36261, partial [Reticulomyxa filosa]